jgi:tetratricopeptide (TPR) repeat protein
MAVEKYRKIDDRIDQGYKLLRSGQTVNGCDVLLDAWEDIKSVMAEDKVKDLSSLQGQYKWTEFMINYVQDLEEELHNAAIEDPKYLHRRIHYCEELLDVCDDDELIIENTRRAIAESHFALGNKEECDRLFRTWLAQDPAWGWGYIGWSDCYQYGTKNIAADHVKAEEIINSGLKEKNLRDRADVVDRAIGIYADLGKDQQAAELEKELRELNASSKSKTVANTPITVIKIGRNEPCPCGSGKKHKKCCGK